MVSVNQKIEAPRQMLENRDQIYRLSLSSLLLLAFLFTPYSAYAAGCADPLCKTICIVANWFSGSLGKSIATLGIVVLGIGAMMGKVSWPMALITSVGIAVMVSGGQIVNLLTSKANVCEGIGGGPDAGQIASVLCTLASWAQSKAGKALGSISVIILGVTALMGKISPGMGILLATGIATIFGADQLAVTIAGASGGNFACTPN